MGDLLWPGAERAGALFTDSAILEGMLDLEAGWSDALVAHGLAPATAVVEGDRLLGMLSGADLGRIGLDAETTGDVVTPLVSTLRNHLQADGRTDAAAWLHQGLSSRDVVDTALMLCTATALRRLELELDAQATALDALAHAHRGTAMRDRVHAGPAAPTTFGLRAREWHTAIEDARASVVFAHGALPAQVGGEAGTLAHTVEVARLRGLRNPEQVATAVARDVATGLGLAPAPAWHTTRHPLTRAGDAFAAAAGAMGRIAGDVLDLTRPAVGSLGEPAAPRTAAPTPGAQRALATLVRRAALTTPGTAATLHTLAGTADTDLLSGAWHAEGATLRDLACRTVVAAAHATRLLEGLRVDVVAMRSHLEGDGELLAERDAARALVADGLDGVEDAAAPEPAPPAPGEASEFLGVASHVAANVTPSGARRG
ncbi:lyase family protein [Nocardioides zeae]|uniref:Lyase family protein n=1 Tax=Nocardioides imazamoxiresistens TaxID=3231893 RepID=A0ABU3PW85_9ACTN|nr:lyase family protein [Nocardioides zeae]MDT9593495.1 lyase family protein [Nocardioides zeae]